MYSIIDRFHKVILFAIISLSVVSCSDDGRFVEPEPQRTDMQLRFGVKGGSDAATRVTNHGLSSEFEEGDVVGCVIAFRDAATGKYVYQATTKWHYHINETGDIGVLVLDSIYANDGNQCGSHAATDDDLIYRHPGYAEDEGYVMLNPSAVDAADNAEYCFFFYYPFINSTDVDAAFEEITTSKDPCKLKIPFSGYALELPDSPDSYWYEKNKKDLTVVGFPDLDTKFFTNGTQFGDNPWDKKDESHPHFCWTAFPCFASIAQGSKEQLNNSNFMWVRYVTDQKEAGKPITKEDETTHYTVGLEFRKKMAAIDLVIEDPKISTVDGDLYYRNIPEPKSVNWSDDANVSESFFIIGKRIDLSTGQFTDYPAYRAEWKYRDQDKFHEAEYAAARASHVCDAYEYKNGNTKSASYNRIHPCPLGEGVYRMILPPQTSFKCELHFFTKEGKGYTIDLYSKIPVLKENTLYTIRLRSTDEWDVIIRDWEKGSGMLIEEN